MSAFFLISLGLALGVVLGVALATDWQDARWRVEAAKLVLDPTETDLDTAFVERLRQWGEDANQAEPSDFGDLISPLAPEIERPGNLRPIDRLVPTQRGPVDAS